MRRPAARPAKDPAKDPAARPAKDPARDPAFRRARRRGRRLWWCGALTPPALAAALTAATVLVWPERGVILDAQRMLENLLPQAALLGLVLAGALALLGRRRLALALVLLNLAGAAQVGWRLWQGGDPLWAAAAPVPDVPVLDVLWFNLLKDNPLPPAELVGALAAAPADVVILGEAAALRPVLDDPALGRAFPVQAGCRGTRCELLVLARDPRARLSIRRLYPPRIERIARVEIGGAPGAPDLTVLGMHLYKPWYAGPAAHDNWFAVDEIGRTRGPLAVVGDFNAAPWSDRIRILHNLCGMRGLRRPPPTWPKSLGSFGVPIDQVLTRSGARVVTARAWGQGLGSNHLGLLARIAISVPASGGVAVPASGGVAVPASGKGAAPASGKGAAPASGGMPASGKVLVPASGKVLVPASGGTGGIGAPASGGQEDCRIPLGADGYPVRPVRP